MPKPIVLMYIPDNFSVSGKGPSEAASEMMYQMNGWNDKIVPRPEIVEYLWLVFQKEGIQAPEMKVFHPKDFTEAQFEELKSLVITELEIMKQTPE